MSKKMIFYVALVLITSNLFYGEYWGLNTLIVSVLSVVIGAIGSFYDPDANKPNSFKWWFAATLFIVNGFAVFYSSSYLSATLYILSFFYFSAVHNAIQISLPLGFAQSVQALFSGFFHFTESVINNFQKKEKGDANRIFVRVLIYSIPIIIAIVFLKLYQNADETFYEMTKFINLDWISWGFLGFYVIIFISGYGLFFYHKSKEITDFEEALKNDVSDTYEDGIQNYIGIDNEQKIALSLLITLNLMLLLYNIIDLKFIFVDLPNPEPTLRYSELLHGGVNSLITSIILVIFIITFIYRGQLNFQGSKAVRILAFIWLMLNLTMVCTTVIKNYEYISHWGLTYKRIGVYIYLLLAAVGLILTIIKIARIKSIWFLIRNTSLAFVTCFSLMGLVNWDSLIVNYNLTKLKPAQIDFDYLMELGDDAYPDLIAYYNDHNTDTHVQARPDLWLDLFDCFTRTRLGLQLKYASVTWRSFNMRELRLLNRMEKYNLIYTPRIDSGYDQYSRL